MENRKVLFAAQGITACYGRKEVLCDISFSAASRTLTGLIGANGCGKTTLLRCITNQMEHQGACYLQGERTEALSERQRSRIISYIPQNNGVKISLPILDVVLMGFNPVLRLLEQPSKTQIQKARDTLNMVGLEGMEEADYLTLSEGQKQLVILARTMVQDACLLLMDEPDSALDIQNRYKVMKYIRKMVVSGEKAGLISLHDPMLALEFCDQLLLLADGRCVDILFPKVDSAEKMEAAFRRIYEKVSLVEYKDRKGRKHLSLVWEE